MRHKLVLHEANPHFIHHQKSTPSTAVFREIIFGMEDGMVSTMGAVTGIAAASQNHFMVVLSGIVIIAVESISMAVGSYLSTKSEKEIDERKIQEELVELRDFPAEEQQELKEMYTAVGWPKELAGAMAAAAAKDEKIFLQEMAFRELKIIPENMQHPLKNGIAMGISYIVGGAIPLLPYLLYNNSSQAIPVSVGFTLCALFALGVYTTKFSRRAWWKAGFEMLALASAAGFVGYYVGQMVDVFWIKK
jgi:predicted membrane protein (TIGR00267 family)